jgi:signal transduction histidine kinase
MIADGRTAGLTHDAPAPVVVQEVAVRPRSRLFRKYIALFVALVGGTLLANGALEIWFSYQEHKTALARIQHEKALGAVTRIEQFIDEITRQIGWTARAQWAPSVLDQRRLEYLQLLRQAPAVTEVAHLDARGREDLRVSRLAMDVIGSGIDMSGEAKFSEAKARKIWFSPVYFRKESEPYITIALAGTGRDTGVTVAEVNLKFIWDVISRIKVGKAGYAYVVDSRGLLIAHPDIGLVLRKTDLSTLPQVAGTLDGKRDAADDDEALVGRDLAGQEVLTANAAIAGLDWRLFVDLPLSEAFAAVYESLARTAGLILVGLLLAVGAGVVLARRMVVPITALQEGAARIGAGDLARRIEVRTNDELEALADQFNSMAAQLQDSYAGLERTVDERTSELRESLDQQTATADVLKVISRSRSDLQPVLDTLIATSARLCHADNGFLFRLTNGIFRLQASYQCSPEFMEFILRNPIPEESEGTIVGRTAKERRPVHFPDIVNDPRYTWSESQRIGRFRSVLGVPLLRDGLPIGVIVVWRERVEPFTGKQIDLLATFADQGVIAIENARLLDELQHRTDALAQSVEELQALGEVGRAVSATLDLKTVLETVVARGAELAEANACAIYRYRPSTQQFRLWHAAGLDTGVVDAISGLEINRAETAMGRAVELRDAVQISDLTAQSGGKLRDVTLSAGYRAVLIVPLIGGDRVFGALVLQRREPGDFSANTVNLLRTFASQSILAIQNARLFREIEEKSRQLEIASQHKSQFLANMSHELRTPLNAILGYAELLLDGLYGNLTPKSQAVLERVQNNGKHLLALINDVLDLAKIEAGQFTLVATDYSIDLMVQSVISATESLARAKGLALSAEVTPGLPTGYGDERRLTQVLLNLVGNAIKFTDQGSVQLAARAENGHFTVLVRDTGPGIAAADQDRIFQEFQQVDNSSTRKKGGTGLGLAISRRIVEMHGGTIGVESVPGQGATFRIDLPIRGQDGKEAA